ncbi:F-box/LRR-repeat protein 4-like [Trifolium pratense]|uniref:F-box/LRR-repeat protein 4-like n=1 Tax=Trifolium pratense TaxID=57577 RepID=UPI001E691EE5|nr:F-box/LRR-repeat protein 4-like [Trifolium pratense]
MQLATDIYLPDDCWEYIFKFIIFDGHIHNGCYFDYLSLVSKQFLSITNRLLLSNTILSATPRPLLPSFFQRFPNLISLTITNCHDVDVLLSEISLFPLKFTSLNISYKPIIPTDGLRAFSQNITTLTSLNCSHMRSINGTDLFLIADCFPLLEELDLGFPIELENYDSLQIGVKALSSKLLKLRKVNLTYHEYINDQLLVHLFSNWKLLEEAVIFGCDLITKSGITAAIRERPTLRSLSFTSDFAVDVAALVKSLCLADNFELRDESVEIFVSLFPNLQFLNLRNCRKISENIIYQVLKRCCKIRHLDLSGCSLKLLGLNFEVPNLEVLNLSLRKVDDETLYVISKSCRGLLKLVMLYCHGITEKGVKHVVENCTQLREIELKSSSNVDANVVASMALSRPLLRKITPPECPLGRC